MTHAFKKVFLIILDGFGLGPAGKGNPISIAKMPFLNSLIAKYPAFSVVASGLVVGLPWGKPGNSEVGHSAIGTGRVTIQDWARINGEIQSGDFFKNPAFLSAIEHCRKHNSSLHIIGCTSPGGIHSHEDHLFGLLELAAREKLLKVFVHMITDGEDSGQEESSATLERLRPSLAKAGAKIATVIGRVYGMDRVFNWELTQKAWRAMVEGIGEQITDVDTYLALNHKNRITDDLILPAVVLDDGKPVSMISDHDAVIFFNYRNDRAKQMLTPFVTPEFKGFTRAKVPADLFVVSMTRYSNAIPVNAVAYEAADIHHTLGKEISRRNLKQFRVAEKEKEAHINNFFNGGRIDPYDGTEQLVVASQQLRASQYPKHPEMSAKQIAAELIARKDEDFVLYLANFANPDMMAHTGNIEATVAGLKIVDACLKDIVEAVLKNPEAALVITCDHGNCEELIDPATGGVDTQHSASNVMALFAGDGLARQETGGSASAVADKTLASLADENPLGSLVDIAPTVLKLLSFEQPPEMTGTSLL